MLASTFNIILNILNRMINLKKIFTVVVLLGEVRVLDAGADVAIVLLPVVEEGEDGVDEQQQHKAQDH